MNSIIINAHQRLCEQLFGFDQPWNQQKVQGDYPSTPTEPETPEPLKEFHPFTRLPAELRAKIWKQVIVDQEPQFFEIFPCFWWAHIQCFSYVYHLDYKTYERTDGRKNGYHICRRLQNVVHTFALASTNAESRVELKADWGTIICLSQHPVGFPKIAHYNLATDFVAIPFHDLRANGIRRRPRVIWGLDKIRKLIILDSCKLHVSHCARLEVDQFLVLIESLTSLKEVYVEFSEDGPYVGHLRGMSLSQATATGGFMPELRATFECRKKQIMEERRRQRWNSVIETIELVQCERG